MSDNNETHEQDDEHRVSGSELSGLVRRDAEHIKKVRARLEAWQEEFRTNRRGMAASAEKHIAFLKKELKRIDA